MRAKEFIVEAIAPVAPVASAGQQPAGPTGLDQSIQQAQTDQQPDQTPKTQEENRYIPIIQGLRRVAAKQPVGKTGNAGIDNLLFNIAGLSGAPNTFDKAVSGMLGGTFDPTSTMKRATFSHTPRSGTDIRKGIPADEPTTLTPGVANAKGLSTKIDNRVAGQAELIAKIKELATVSTVPRIDARTGEPLVDQNGNQVMIKAAVANPTKNPGVDNLLDSAGVQLQQPQQTRPTAGTQA